LSKFLSNNRELSNGYHFLFRYFINGVSDLAKAWQAEHDETADRSIEANEKFNSAKRFFQKSSRYDPASGKYKNWLAVTTLKIEGNRHFNEGLERQLEGAKLEMSSKYAEGKAQYELARSKFEQGLQLSGDKRFQVSIDFVKEQISEVEDRLTTARMNLNFQGLKVNQNQASVETGHSKMDEDKAVEVECVIS
jgi:hypothetical protein